MAVSALLCVQNWGSPHNTELFLFIARACLDWTGENWAGLGEPTLTFGSPEKWDRNLTVPEKQKKHKKTNGYRIFAARPIFCKVSYEKQIDRIHRIWRSLNRRLRKQILSFTCFLFLIRSRSQPEQKLKIS